MNLGGKKNKYFVSELYFYEERAARLLLATHRRSDCDGTKGLMSTLFSLGAEVVARDKSAK